MSRLATSFILGYHGCDAKVADEVIAGRANLNPSQNDFDWLGHGIYFWEADPWRALEFAQSRVEAGVFASAAVIGAVIDLRNCLDLTKREDLDLVKSYHDFYALDQALSELPMPKNKNAKGDANEDLLLRYLDCAVINYIHLIVDKTKNLESYDTVRGMFTEGGPLYPGAGVSAKTHTQVAVRTSDCIIGYFKPRIDLEAGG